MWLPARSMVWLNKSQKRKHQIQVKYSLRKSAILILDHSWCTQASWFVWVPLKPIAVVDYGLHHISFFQQIKTKWCCTLFKGCSNWQRLSPVQKHRRHWSMPASVVAHGTCFIQCFAGLRGSNVHSSHGHLFIFCSDIVHMYLLSCEQKPTIGLGHDDFLTLSAW